MTTEATIALIVFLMVSSGVILGVTLVRGRRTVLDARLSDLAGQGRGGSAFEPAAPVAQFVRTTLPRVGTALIPSNEEKRTQLQTRLIQAGLYSRQAMAIFLVVKLILMFAPPLGGLVAGVLGVLPLRTAMIFAGYLSLVGMAGPRLWLSRRKTRRQATIRRSLPDTLDLLVICVEGGLSLGAALHRVAGEMRTAYPVLALELTIVQREINLGLVPGEALKQMGERTDLEEIVSLASVITQAERFGASLVASLRVHANTLREKRKQRAEEMAQKAAIKVLFPTLLFIFPAIFIIILGPAGIKIYAMFSGLKK